MVESPTKPCDVDASCGFSVCGSFARWENRGDRIEVLIAERIEPSANIVGITRVAVTLAAEAARIARSAQRSVCVARIKRFECGETAITRERVALEARTPTLQTIRAFIGDESTRALVHARTKRAAAQARPARFGERRVGRELLRSPNVQYAN